MAEEDVKAKDEKDFGDDLLEAQRKAAKQRVILETIGPAAGGKTGDDALIKATKDALDIQSATMKSIDEARKTAQDAWSKAETEKNNALSQLYQHQLDTIKEAEARVQMAAAKIEGGQSKSAMDVFRDVKSELDKIMEELPKPPSPPQPGVSEDTQIKLKQMELDQAKVLFELQSGAEQQRKQWDLKLREFDEETKHRWAEYRDTKEFRNKGIEGFSDLITSIGASITKERTGGSEGPHLEATVSSFPCQVCGTEIEVEPGAASVNCPNTECHASYDIKERAG